MGEYRWVYCTDLDPEAADTYQTLLRPDGTEVTTITEPEDRTGFRDLAPVAAELNALSARERKLVEALDEANADRCEHGHHTHAECDERCACWGQGKSLIEQAERRAEEAEERCEKLVEALREAEGALRAAQAGGCENAWPEKDRTLRCPERFPEQRSAWCGSCRATAARAAARALLAHEGEEKRIVCGLCGMSGDWDGVSPRCRECGGSVNPAPAEKPASEETP